MISPLEAYILCFGTFEYGEWKVIQSPILLKSVENQKIEEALDYKGLREQFGDF